MSVTTILSHKLAALKRAPRVLLVEDDQDDATLTTMELNAWGCEVTWVRSGEEAINVASTGMFDAGLVDLKLPTMSGVEVAKYLRSHYPMLVVFLYSGIFDGFMISPKPFKMEQVKTMAESLGIGQVY